MCPPTYFDVEYSINPWMDPSRNVDHGLATEQWQEVKALLESHGDRIRLLEPAPGLADMTFAGDAGFVWGDFFVPSNFRFEERRGEVTHYVRWFKERGFTINPIPEEILFEGQGDIVFGGHRAIAGHGSRSDPQALAQMRSLIPDVEFVASMEIVDDHYFHLAMALSFLDEHTVLCYPPAFTPASLAELERTIETVIRVSREDADVYFACNNLVVGDSFIVDGATDGLRKDLRAAGYDVVACPVSEFKKSGGSLRCLVLTFLPQ